MGKRSNLIDTMRAQTLGRVGRVGHIKVPYSALGAMKPQPYPMAPPTMPGRMRVMPITPGSQYPGFTITDPQSVQKFAQWVGTAFPKLYAAAERHTTGKTLGGVRGLRGLGQDETPAAGDSSSGGFWSNLVDTITKIAPQYLQYKTQQDLLDAQLARARAGLPPLNTSQYAPSVQFSVNPQQASQAAAYAWAQAKPFVIAGAVGLGALLLFRTLSPRRRR